MIKRFFSFLLFIVFIFAAYSFLPATQHSAEAKAKKIYRKAKYKKKVYRKAKIKRVRKKVKRAFRKVKRKKVVQKKIRKVQRIHEPAYRLPARTGTIIQKYTLEEGADEAEAARIVSELKSLGADDASINVETSALQVKFNAGKLSAVGIMKKLKDLGFTVKRID